MRKRPGQQFAAAMRWLHIYLSMLGFGTILFFSVTGLTLNHPDWFGVHESTQDVRGTVEPIWLATGETDDVHVDRLSIAEFLRSAHSLKGAVADFRCDEYECSIAWTAPGYAADAVIDRETGAYTLSIVRHGFVAVINDLHKGRDSGAVWSIVIDVTAILMTISSLTGLTLLLFIRRKRVSGMITAVVGTVALAAVYALFVR